MKSIIKLKKAAHTLPAITATCSLIVCTQSIAADVTINGSLSVSGFGASLVGFESTESLSGTAEFSDAAVENNLITKDDLESLLFSISTEACLATPNKLDVCRAQTWDVDGLGDAQIPPESVTVPRNEGDPDHPTAASYALTGTNVDLSSSGGPVNIQIDSGPTNGLVPVTFNLGTPTSDVTANGTRTITGPLSFSFSIGSGLTLASFQTNSGTTYTITLDVTEAEETNIPLPFWSLFVSGLAISWIATRRLRKRSK